MRRDRPSTTASAVAFARAVAALPGSRAPSSDPFAKALLHPALGVLLRALEPLAERTRAVDLALRVASVGLVDHLALRTAAIDAALEARLAAGLRQLVVLGAGLDARAYRLRGIEDAVVLEVDHPATQRFKRERARSLRPRARELRWVAVDFERERLADRLAAEGHDASAPTLWLWEGVLPYLAPAATAATLEQIRARSAPGSALVLTYGPSHDQPWLALAPPVHLAFRALGEPLRGLMTREELHGLLAAAGFRVESDTGTRDWRARYAWGIRPLLLIEERLVVARADA
ncbi:MAG TPA: SAM-dependent methyltransferase [Sandaracinaceae bacterium]